MHADEGAFDDAVAGSYRTAAGDQEWGRALGRVAAMFGAVLAALSARVASRRADRAAPEQIAQAFGTTLTTERTHLRAVLDRVGLQRNDELVRVLHDGHVLWGSSAESA